MLSALNELPKAVDAFIVGVIELIYAYFGAVLRIAARPVTGPRKLRDEESLLSSRTVLFVSCGFLSVADFVGLEELNGLFVSDGLGSLLLRIVLFYIAFDTLSAVAALICEVKERDAARSIMRFAFASSLGVLALLHTSFQALRLGTGIEVVVPDPTALPIAGQVLIVLALSVLCFYAPGAALVALGRPRSDRRARRILTWLGGAATMVSALLMLAAVVSMSGWIGIAMGGKIRTSSESCDLKGDTLHIATAIRNNRSEAVALSHHSFQVELAPHAKGTKLEDSFGPASIFLFFDQINDDLLVIKPNEVGVFKADAVIEPKDWDAIRKGHFSMACRLVTGLLPSRVFDTTPRHMGNVPADPAPSATVEPDFAPVPIYRPGPPRPSAR